jgi:hypothetical protein
MARRIRSDFRNLPRDVYKTWVDGENEGMSSTQLLQSLKRKCLKPVTPLKQIRRMTKMASKRSGIPISITKDMGKRGMEEPPFDRAGGIAGRRVSDKKIVVHIHPIMQYRTKRTINDTIEHELDHVKVMKKQKTFNMSKG